MIQFVLPPELIAQKPAQPRDQARLLVYNRTTQKINDDYFYNLAEYLPKNTRVVANNSKVIHCRYLFDSGATELFAIETVNDHAIRALVRPGRKFKIGNTRQLTACVTATVTAVDTEGIRTVQFSTTLDHPELQAARHVPLPPYIAQNDTLASEYQTIYAKEEGSLAAPTAGLHFTPELKKHIEDEFMWSELTLEVGLGTFAPLTKENIENGILHEETYRMSSVEYEKIKNAQHITAIGTTTVRTLETVFSQSAPVLNGSTQIFIQPGYRFRRVDSLITNFHLPNTSLLLLVEAFVGSSKEAQMLYNHAISSQYRFYSFGDAMLIL